MFTKEERDIESVELRKMVQLDAAFFREAFRLEALEEARKMAFEQGFEQGEPIGRILLAQQLLKRTPSLREDLLKLSLDELTRLADALEQQLLSASNGTS